MTAPIPQTPRQRRAAAEAWIAELVARHALAKRLGIAITVGGRLHVEVA